MRPTHIRNPHLDDPIARAHRRSLMYRYLFIGGGLAALMFSLVWVFFFSNFFAIYEIDIHGGSDTLAVEARSIMDGARDKKSLHVLPTGKNILLFNTASIRDQLMAQLPSVESVSVKKAYPHTINLEFSERKAYGIWCRNDACQYWDLSGARWGSAASSIGPLLLLVQDQRSHDDTDSRLVVGMLKAVDGLPEVGLHARSIALPDAEPGGITIKTNKGYDLMMDTYSDVADQLDTLSVFLADRAADATFKPVYLDLRTAGRVYYK